MDSTIKSPPSFKVGEAPWEQKETTKSFKVGEAPWETKGEQSILDEELMGVTPRGLIKGGLSALPTVGMFAGGALGGGAGAASPIPGGAALGAVGGAGLGSAAGESLKQFGEKYILGEEGAKSTEDYLKSIGTSAAEGAFGEVGGQVIGPALKAVSKIPIVEKGIYKIGEGATKIAHTLTGLSENEIKTYAKNADEIKQMSKSSDNNISLAADEVRKNYFKDIDATRKSMNEKITNALQNSSEAIDATPIISKFADEASKINQKLYPDQLKQIQDLIEKTKSLGSVDKSGKLTLSVQDAYDLTKYLQEEASNAYRNPGQVFSMGTKAANAAKGAASVSRDLVSKTVPDIASANKTLSKLHDIEDSMNLNLISEGKPEAGLLAAGTRGNIRNVNYLKQLGDITGKDFLSEADKLAAMRSFGNPPLMPVDTTGKSLTRMGLGAGLGYLADDKKGAVIGAGLTSPAALKALIDSGLLGKEVLSPMAIPAIKGLIQRSQGE